MSNTRATLRLTLPATSANLGPAFDAAAIALNIFLRVSASAADDFSVVAHGRDAELCGNTRGNLILTTYREILRTEGARIKPLALRVQNEIPIGKGCGSSAAARLAAIMLAVHYGRLDWDEARIVGEAARREDHADNAAACWTGGLAIGRRSERSQAQVIRVLPRGSWPLLLAVPDEALSTEKARRVLPRSYSREDAVCNVQNSMLLLASFAQGRHDWLASALEDRFHQPYRVRLCPLLPALQKLAGKHGILGVALSGAGPAVLMFLDPRANARQIQAEATRHLRGQHLRAELLPTSITCLGARQRSGG